MPQLREPNGTSFGSAATLELGGLTPSAPLLSPRAYRQPVKARDLKSSLTPLARARAAAQLPPAVFTRIEWLVASCVQQTYILPLNPTSHSQPLKNLSSYRRYLLIYLRIGYSPGDSRHRTATSADHCRSEPGRTPILKGKHGV